MADDSGLRGTRLAAQSWIIGLIEKGFGNTQITEFLREFDLGYRNQEMFRDVNRLREGILSQQAVRALGPGEEVPESAMVPVLGRQVEPYRAVVTMSVFNENTGDVEDVSRTYWFRGRPSQNDVLSEVDKSRDRYQEQEGWSITGVSNIMYERVIAD